MGKPILKFENHLHVANTSSGCSSARIKDACPEISTNCKNLRFCRTAGALRKCHGMLSNAPSLQSLTTAQRVFRHRGNASTLL